MTYVYLCKACNEQFEANQRMSDEPLTKCWLCRKEGTVGRVPQPVGISYNAPGFYATDSRATVKRFNK